MSLIRGVFASFLILLLSSSCKKLIEIPDPATSVTSDKIFSSDKQAEGALAGIYSRMINSNGFTSWQAATESTTSGLATILGGLSSDELYLRAGVQNTAFYYFSTNKLNVENSGTSAQKAWASAYKTISTANAVIEGLNASTSPGLRDSVKKVFRGEAKLARAVCYFYLTNLFGEVPLALVMDYNTTIKLPNATQQDIYRQIVADLQEAYTVLPGDYTAGRGERVRPNKWTAAALLARVALYLRDYPEAAAKASEVLAQTSLYELDDLNKVFLANSREAIWQLKQTTEDLYILKNATQEGFALLPVGSFTSGATPYCLTTELRHAFEPGDKRYTAWVDSTNNKQTNPNAPFFTWYPKKYKIGGPNAVAGAPAPEYYMVVRLAEVLLIRAEAAAHGAGGGIGVAIDDLNQLRHRAGIPLLSKDLSAAAVLDAVAAERRIELFAEWGHRWLDLKRTGKAREVLSKIALKQPWAGDYQLLYPIPKDEINKAPFLKQNPGYNAL